MTSHRVELSLRGSTPIERLARLDIEEQFVTTAVGYLGSSGKSRRVHQLLEDLRTDADPKSRRKALRTYMLVNQGTELETNILQAFSDSDITVRDVGFIGLARLPEGSPLSLTLATTVHSLLKDQAQIGDQAAGVLVAKRAVEIGDIGALLELSIGGSQSAELALKSLGEKAVPVLCQQHLRVADPKHRAAAAEYLGKLEIQNPNLRKGTLGWLIWALQNGNPSAATALRTFGREGIVAVSKMYRESPSGQDRNIAAQAMDTLGLKFEQLGPRNSKWGDAAPEFILAELGQSDDGTWTWLTPEAIKDINELEKSKNIKAAALPGVVFSQSDGRLWRFGTDENGAVNGIAILQGKQKAIGSKEEYEAKLASWKLMLGEPRTYRNNQSIINEWNSPTGDSIIKFKLPDPNDSWVSANIPNPYDLFSIMIDPKNPGAIHTKRAMAEEAWRIPREKERQAMEEERQFKANLAALTNCSYGRGDSRCQHLCLQFQRAFTNAVNRCDEAKKYGGKNTDEMNDKCQKLYRDIVKEYAKGARTVDCQ